MDITINEHDTSILRGLSEQIAEVAALEVQNYSRVLHRGVKDLEKRPFFLSNTMRFSGQKGTQEGIKIPRFDEIRANWV